MKRNHHGKIILYCVIAFSVTCILGTIGLVFYAAWKNDTTVREVFFGQKTADVGSSTEHAGDDAGMAAAEEYVPEDLAPEPDKAPEAEENEALKEAAGDETLAAAPAASEETPLPEIETDRKREATLVFGGDICFHDPFANMGAYRERGSDIRKCISPYLLGEMQDADICMVNNEFSYSDRGAPLEGKAYTFRSKPQNVEILHDMGVDIVSVANNHAYDYGRDAFEDTLRTLEDAGVYHVGGGRNLDEASEPVYLMAGGLKIGYVSATQIERNDYPDTKGATADSPGVLRCFGKGELDHFLEVVKTAKENCDFLVVYIHWGTENTDVPDWAQPYQADLISLAGADVIVGCHPHCLQGLTVMNNVPVIYSLGNYWFNSKTVDTALLKMKVGESGIESLQMIAARQSGCSTNELTGGERDRVIGYLQSLSPDVTFDSEGFVSW